MELLVDKCERCNGSCALDYHNGCVVCVACGHVKEAQYVAKIDALEVIKAGTHELNVESEDPDEVFGMLKENGISMDILLESSSLFHMNYNRGQYGNKIGEISFTCLYALKNGIYIDISDICRKMKVGRKVVESCMEEYEYLFGGEDVIRNFLVRNNCTNCLKYYDTNRVHINKIQCSPIVIAAAIVHFHGMKVSNVCKIFNCSAPSVYNCCKNLQ